MTPLPHNSSNKMSGDGDWGGGVVGRNSHVILLDAVPNYQDSIPRRVWLNQSYEVGEFTIFLVLYSWSSDRPAELACPISPFPRHCKSENKNLSYTHPNRSHVILVSTWHWKLKLPSIYPTTQQSGCKSTRWAVFLIS